MRIAVVTASIGEGRRGLYTPGSVNESVDYIAFVDRKVSHAAWRPVRVDRLGDCSTRDAKRFKVLPEEYIGDEFDAVIWVDRHCRLLCDPVEFFEEFSEDVAVVSHYRGDIYSEAKACLLKKKDDEALIRRTVSTFRLEGWPRKSGLFYGGFIAKRITEESKKFSRLWWQYIEAGSRRDQLSLPVALDRSGVSVRKFKRRKMAELFKIRGK